MGQTSNQPGWLEIISYLVLQCQLATHEPEHDPGHEKSLSALIVYKLTSQRDSTQLGLHHASECLGMDGQKVQAYQQDVQRQLAPCEPKHADFNSNCKPFDLDLHVLLFSTWAYQQNMECQLAAHEPERAADLGSADLAIPLDLGHNSVLQRLDQVDEGLTGQHTIPLLHPVEDPLHSQNDIIAVQLTHEW